MHKIDAKEFTLDDFSHERLIDTCLLERVINELNIYRDIYNNYDRQTERYKTEFSKKDIWWQMIQLLPSSYNQKRTLKLNYEVLANMYEFRKDHKLDEWRELMEYFKKNCPYSEIFTVDSVKARIDTAVNEALIKAKDDIHNMLLEYIYESRNVELLRLLDENIKMIIDTHLHKTEDKND